MRRPYTVFISHSSRDVKIARFISGQIELARVGYFLDDVHLKAGDKFRQVINDTIPQCQELLLLLSRAALSSHWLTYELGSAEAHRLTIAPLLLDIGAEDVARHPGWRGLVADRTMLPFERLPLYLQQLRERAGMPQDSRVIRRGDVAQEPLEPGVSDLQRHIGEALKRLRLRD